MKYILEIEKLIVTCLSNNLELLKGEKDCGSRTKYFDSSLVEMSKLIFLKQGRSCCEADWECTEVHETGLNEAMSPLSALGFSDLYVSDELLSEMEQAAIQENYEKEENNHKINLTMTLPIYTSINSGNLREEKLYASKNDRDIFLLCEEVSDKCLEGNPMLTNLEDGMTNIVERDHLADVAEEYENDRALRRKAEEQRKEQFTPFNESNIVHLDGFITNADYSTAYEKLLYKLGTAENKRTMLAIMKLVASAHDDELLQKELYKFMTEILSLSENANVLIVKLLLCQFYLELYHTFKPVLKKDKSRKLLFDFENIYYYIIGRYPDEETKRKYNESVRKTIPVPLYATSPSENNAQHSSQPSDTGNARITQFNREANRYGFYQMEKVKALGSQEKIQKLVLLILDSTQHEQPFGYAAAMLKYLGFEKQFKQYCEGRYNIRKYDKECEIMIMNYSEEEAGGTAFRHYRQSVSIDPADENNSNYSRLGWKYYNGIVQKDYEDILKG